MQSSNVILGIDPGFDRLGWAVATGDKNSISILDARCISPPKSANINKRLSWLFHSCQKLLQEIKPTVAAIENIYFSKNITSAIHVAQVRGIILALLFEQNIPVFDYNPMQIKLAVAGNGRATKMAIKKMLGLQMKISDHLLLDDALDAVAVCLTHHLHSRQI
jgi:crossover junction endodeoxyribonuclease RuvC